MNIYVDGMGGDNSPGEIVQGCIMAAKSFNRKICIIGEEQKLYAELDKQEYVKELIEVIPSLEVITNNEDPTIAIRRKKQSSLVIGLQRIKADRRSILISAGSTGALLAGGTLIVGRIKGIQRPALTVMLPTKKGFSLLLDAGANVDCKASYLQQFAIMSSIYVEELLGVTKPRVGLINIGSEEKKGNELTKETYGLLKETDVNFVGNIEARDIPEGNADILVCDGFTGNIILKLMEGLGLFIFDALKKSIISSTRAKIGGLLLKPALKIFKKRFDYTEVGGAPLLGVNGGIIKAHGNSDRKAIYNAIKQGIEFQEKNIIDKISNKIVKVQE
ncbi:phosphate acyltransferase PlsX [Alkalibaculum sp. M08DMB]|uniref:Phosphate acyltransferase n=1 Tax=Alkalibaculum sporogenes TaxID=2655001 RepID=A0A6A7K9R5_9FIRM|nr:phosphate acyltransferase PlsX [Alkalibaculum sporogenes]MPW26051.1 phosphate acyltransferase PlsX [Alkalibaculum sporogenes]